MWDVAVLNRVMFVMSQKTTFSHIHADTPSVICNLYFKYLTKIVFIFCCFLFLLDIFCAQILFAVFFFNQKMLARNYVKRHMTIGYSIICVCICVFVYAFVSLNSHPIIVVRINMLVVVFYYFLMNSSLCRVLMRVIPKYFNPAIHKWCIHWSVFSTGYLSPFCFSLQLTNTPYTIYWMTIALCDLVCWHVSCCSLLVSFHLCIFSKLMAFPLYATIMNDGYCCCCLPFKTGFSS